MMYVKLVDRRPVSLNCSSFVLQSSADEPHDDEAFFPVSTTEVLYEVVLLVFFPKQAQQILSAHHISRHIGRDGVCLPAIPLSISETFQMYNMLAAWHVK